MEKLGLSIDFPRRSPATWEKTPGKPQATANLDGVVTGDDSMITIPFFCLGPWKRLFFPQNPRHRFHGSVPKVRSTGGLSQPMAGMVFPNYRNLGLGQHP